ncbi:MAG: MBL fold metallo-hydrolase [Thermoanaerobaculia bacterium]
MKSEVSLYFPHAGKGQSVLVRFPGNRWIVVDANQRPDGKPNPTVELLRGPSEEPGFEVLAVVVTHLHTDHYSGLPAVLDFCEEVARKRGCLLGDVLGTLILPRSYGSFFEMLEGAARPYLETLLARLKALSEGGFPIRSLHTYEFAWRSLGNGDLEPEECWLITLYPPSNAVSRWLLGGRNPEVNLPPPVVLGSSLANADNQFAYILGVGYGREEPDLHALLTSDIPGESFASLTRDLGQTVLPGIRERKIGAPFSLGLLVRQEATTASAKADAPDRLRAVQCLTVPHHGSGRGPAAARDLLWWLDAPDRQPKRPAFAVVQGDSRALKQNTLDELSKADLQVFTTAKPLNFVGLPAGHTGCTALDARIMAGAPWPAPSAQPSRVLGDDDDPPLSAHLAVFGGKGGIHRVIAQNVFRIVPYAPFSEHYDSATVFDAAGPAGR